MADIGKDAQAFRLLTGMMPPGRSEPPSIVGQNMYERRDVRTRLWLLFGKLTAVNAKLRAKLSTQEAIVSKLKKSKDGVPVVDGDTLWFVFLGEIVAVEMQWGAGDIGWEDWFGQEASYRTLKETVKVLIGDGYSTRGAAEAARDTERSE